MSMQYELQHIAAHPGWIRKNARITIGGGAVLFFALVALLAPVIAPYGPGDQDLNSRLIPPIFFEGGSWAHILGTDNIGRDNLSLLMYGARLSLLVGIGTVSISALIGGAMGLVSGYFGRRIDLAVNFLLTVRLSLPIMLTMLALVGLVGNSLFLIVVVLSLFLWDRFLVVTRSLTIQLRERDFVQAARASGASNRRIIVREILPNLAGPLVVVATLEAAHAILLEAALSFLGLGITPPSTSWGLMMADAKDFVFFAPWLINIPGLTILLLILSINILGDGLRKYLVNDEV